MKTATLKPLSLRALLAGAVLLFSMSINAQTLTLQEVWTSDTVVSTPESVRYYPTKNVLFVSCIGSKKPADKDSTGYIALLNLDGSVHTAQWVNGLNAPKGMDVLRGKLFVTDIDELVVIDIATASIEKRIAVDGAVFLNDVACDEPDNSIFFTDSRTGIVHRLKNGKVEVYHKSEATQVLNGLFNTPQTLYLGSNHLLALDKTSGEIKILVENTEQIDGLEQISDQVFIGTNWRGRILGLVAGRPLISLEESQELGYNTADIGSHRQKKTIYVPTFFSNTIKAYKYKITP